MQTLFCCRSYQKSEASCFAVCRRWRETHWSGPFPQGLSNTKPNTCTTSAQNLSSWICALSKPASLKGSFTAEVFHVYENTVHLTMYTRKQQNDKLTSWLFVFALFSSVLLRRCHYLTLKGDNSCHFSWKLSISPKSAAWKPLQSEFRGKSTMLLAIILFSTKPNICRVFQPPRVVWDLVVNTIGVKNSIRCSYEHLCVRWMS